MDVGVEGKTGDALHSSLAHPENTFISAIYTSVRNLGETVSRKP